MKISCDKWQPLKSFEGDSLTHHFLTDGRIIWIEMPIFHLDDSVRNRLWYMEIVYPPLPKKINSDHK